MRQFRVKALSVGGMRNRVFKNGDIVKESDFYYGRADMLVAQGFLEETDALQEDIKPKPISGKIKVAIVAACWKRPEIFELFAVGIQQLIKQCDYIDFTVIIAGSERQASKMLVEKYGFNYIEYPNTPLAAKQNATIKAARKYGPHYILCMGSDDIISPDLMKIYYQYMKKGIDFIGVTDFYFYDTVSKKAAYWGGYRDKKRVGHTAGAARLISSRLMGLWNWSPWEVKHSRVLDNSVQLKLATTPHTKKILSLKQEGVFALDIKSPVNMTAFQLWDNTEFIPVNIIKEHFPYVWNSSSI